MAVTGSRSVCLHSWINSSADYDFRLIPYILSPREQVNVSTIAGKSLSLGPIVVKNLNVDINFAWGSWCLHNEGTMKCCQFDLEPTLDRNGAVLTTPCGGEMEEWSLLRSLDCESGFVEYSLSKSGVAVNDSGQYVYTIANSRYTFNFTTDVRVEGVPIPSPLPLTPEIAAIISTIVTFLISFTVAVIVIVLAGCVVASWWKSAQREEVLLKEAVAELGVAGPVQMADLGVFICLSVSTCLRQYFNAHVRGCPAYSSALCHVT